MGTSPIEYLRWRSHAIARTDEADANVDLERLRRAVKTVLSSDEFRVPPPLMNKPSGKASPRQDGDYTRSRYAKQQVEWLLKRVQLANSAGGPRCRLVWWGTIKE